MNKLVELNKKEMTEINGGFLSIGNFKILRNFKILSDVASIGWRFGKFLAE